MKKVIVVEFIDGNTQTIEAEKVDAIMGNMLIGKPANHEIWLRGLQQIACNGVIADGSNETFVEYIGPSQIKSVKLIYGDGQKSGTLMSVEK